MAFRDSWHRALVYFGLAEDHDPYEETSPTSPRPSSRTATASAPTSGAWQRAAAATSSTTSSPTTSPPAAPTTSCAPSQPRSGTAAAAAPARVHLVIPKSFNDAQQVADKFKDAIPVILNLQGTDTDLTKRLIDFASGLTYALDGGMQRIADKVFMLTPRDVEISAEERARLIEKGFFNQLMAWPARGA